MVTFSQNINFVSKILSCLDLTICKIEHSYGGFAIIPQHWYAWVRLLSTWGCFDKQKTESILYLHSWNIASGELCKNITLMIPSKRIKPRNFATFFSIVNLTFSLFRCILFTHIFSTEIIHVQWISVEFSSATLFQYNFSHLYHV